MICSPLRYPGGKAKMYDFFIEIIKTNSFFTANYCEPYAGGAGLALKLLSTGFVNRITLNDIDDAIFAFWNSIINDTDRFCAMITDTEVTIEEWHRQKAIWSRGNEIDQLQLGFAAYFLNRTNRSGIIDGAGPIGGYHQKGDWKIDVRLNKVRQIDNINSIAKYSDKIKLYNLDALEFISKFINDNESFIYLDPPYYVKGSKLYRNFYMHEDHVNIKRLLENYRHCNWIVSYDDTIQIREIYSDFKPLSYTLNYSAGKKSKGKEVVYLSDTIIRPSLPGFEIAA
jgi:DNA adenine methylase